MDPIRGRWVGLRRLDPGWCCSGGSTNTAAALASLRNDIFTSANGDRPDYPSIAILLTDGVSNDQSATLREAVAVRAQGISLVVVGIGPSPNTQELDGIASYPSTQNVFTATDFNSLSAIRDGLVQAVCNSKRISFTRTSEQHKMHIHVRTISIKCTCDQHLMHITKCTFDQMHNHIWSLLNTHTISI